jgi:hypothetical protein
MRKRTSMRVALRLATFGVAMAGTVVIGQGDVNKVLGDARQALGGEKKLEALKTITVTGRSVRTLPNGNSSEGDFEMAMELPDKFVRRDVLAAMGNMSVYRISGFNGDGVINEVDTPPQLAGGGNVVFRMVTAGPGGAPGDPATQTPEQKEAQRQAALQSAKKDFTRLALGLIVTSLPSYPLTFTHGGTAESPDGTADVIDVKGENFAARLFIDSKTHLPLMLSWMDKEPLRIVRSVGGPGAAGGGQAPTVTAGSGRVAVAGTAGGTFTAAAPAQGAKPLTPEEADKLKQQMAEQMKEAEAKRRTVEFRIYYADYQPVDGVMLPHRIQSSVDGKPTEEITFEKVKVNQKIDAKRFTVSK